MPAPFAPTVVLSDEQRKQLERVERAASTPQSLALRVRLILRAADPVDPSNVEIAADFGCDRHTVATWRGRYLKHGLGGLQDAPRSGRPRSFSPRGTA